MSGIAGFGGGEGGGGLGVPRHPDSELVELQHHWRELLKDTDYFEYLIQREEYASEITNSEEAMKAVFQLDLSGDNE